MKLLKILLALFAAGLIGSLLFIYAGAFNVAADAPHLKPFLWLMETVRQRSIAVRAHGVVVPPLDSPALITAGGEDYNEMCAGCHLQPGVEKSELASAMYPRPPNLGKVKRDNPAETFWIVKHGVKMSGMPAWGATHDDGRMWAMVAFLQQLPRLTPAQYQILTVRSEGDMGGHAHGGDALERMDMPGMESKPKDDHGAEGHAAVSQDTAAADMKGMDMGAAKGAGTPPAAPTATVEAFQRALAAGDTTSAEALLDPNVQVFESGGIERSRDEYAAQHMQGDAAFLKSATLKLLSRTGDGAGAMAWVASESHITGVAGGQDVDLVSTETMVLKRTALGWRIVHIHWSSRKAGAESH